MNGDEIIIHTDGGARGNPGPAACSFVAETDGKIILQESKFLGESTNNYAEYQGVILAMQWLADKSQNSNTKHQISFYLDSELVVRQLNGVYKVKDKILFELFRQVDTLAKNTGLTISYKHVPRSNNKIADFLVNKELDKICK
jgi:ribonuclease HI